MNAPSQCSDKCNSTAKSNIEKSDKASVAKSNELDSTVTEGDILDQLFDQHCLEASGKIDTQAFDQKDADCSTSHTITGLKPISKHWLKTYSGKKKENTVKKKQSPDDSNDQVQSKLVIPRQEPKNLPSDAQLCTNKSLIISNKLPVQKSVQGSCVKVILPSNYPIKILDTKGNLISKPPPILSANIELLKGFRIFRPSLPALASFTSTSVSSQIANQDKETRVPPVNIKPVIQLTEEETPKTEPCINNVQIDSSAKISQDKRSKSPKHVTPCVRIENNQVPSNSKKSNRTLSESRKKERRKSDKIDPVLERTEALRLCIKNHVDLLKNTNAEQPTQVECESGQPNDNMINNQNVIKSTEIMADKERVQSSEVLVEPVLPEEESREVEETSSKEKDLTRSEQESVEKTEKECNSSVEKLERKSKCEVKNKCEELERVPRDNMPEKHLDIGLSEELNLEKKSLGILETEVIDQSSNQINLSDIKLVSTEGTIKLNNPPSENLKTTSDTRQKNVDNESSDLNKIPTGESLKQSENSDSEQQKEESQRNIENSVKDELKNSEVLDDNNVLQRSEVAKSEKMSTSHTEKIPKKTSKVTGTKDDHVKKQPTLLRRRKRKSVDKTEPLKSERNTKMKQQTEKSTSKTLEKESSKDGGEKVMKAQIGSKSTRDQKEHQKEMLTNSADDLPEKELVVKNQENQQGQMEILKSFKEEKVNKGCHKKELISNSENTSIYKQGDEVLAEKDEVQSSEALAEKDEVQSSEVLAEKDEVQSSEVLSEKDEVQSSEVSAKKEVIQSSEVLAEEDVVQSSEVLTEKDEVQSSEVLAEKDVEQSGEVLTEKDEVQNSEVLAEENVVQSSEVLAEENEVQSSEVLAEKDVEQSSEVLAEKDEVQNSEVLAEKDEVQNSEVLAEKNEVQSNEVLDVEQSSEVLTEKDEVQNSEVLAEEDEVQSSEVLAEKDVVQNSEVLAEKDEVQSSEVLAEKDEVQSSEVLAEKDEVQNSEVLAEKDEVQNSEVLAENDEVQNSEVLAEKDEVQSSEVLAEKDEIQSSEVLAEKDEVQSSEVLAEKDEVQSSEVLAEKDEVQSSEMLAEKDEVQSSEVLAEKDVVQSSEVLAEEDEVQSSEVLAEKGVVQSCEVLAEEDEVQSSEVLAEEDEVKSSEVLAEKDEVQSSEVLAEKDVVQSSKVLAEEDEVQSSEVLAEKDVVQSSEVLAEEDEVQSSEVLVEKDEVQNSEVLVEKDEVQSSEVLAEKDEVQSSEVLAEKDAVQSSEVLAEKDVVQSSEVLAEKDVEQSSEVLAEKDVVQSSEVLAEKDVVQSSEVLSEKNEVQSSEVLVEKSPLKETDIKEEGAQILNVQDLMGTNNTEEEKNNPSERLDGCDELEQKAEPIELESTKEDENEISNMVSLESSHVTLGRDANIGTRKRKESGGEDSIERKKRKSACALEARSEIGDFSPENLKTKSLVPSESNRLLIHNEGIRDSSERNEEEPVNTDRMETKLLVQNKHTDTPATDVTKDSTVHNESVTIVSDKTDSTKICLNYDETESHIAPELNSEKTPIVAKNEKPVTIVINEHEDLESPRKNIGVHQVIATKTEMSYKNHPTKSVDHEELNPNRDLLEFLELDNLSKKIPSESTHVSKLGETDDMIESVDAIKKFMDDFNSPEKAQVIDLAGVGSKTSIDDGTTDLQMTKQIRKPDSSTNPEHLVPKSLEKTNGDNSESNNFEMSNPEHNTDTSISIEQEEKELFEFNQNKPLVQVSKECTNSKTKTSVNIEEDKTQAQRKFDQNIAPTKSRVKLRRPGPKSKTDSLVKNETDRTQSPLGIDQKTGPNVRKIGPKSKKDSITCIELDKSEPATKIDQKTGSPTKSAAIVRKPGPKSKTDTSVQIELDESELTPKCDQNIASPTKSGNVRKPGPKSRTETLGTIDLDRSQSSLGSPTESEVNTKSGNVRKPGPKSRTETLGTIDLNRSQSPLGSPTESEVIIRKLGPKTKTDTCTELDKTELSSDQSSPNKRKPCPKSKAKQSLENETELTHFDQDNSQLSATCEFEGNKSYTKNMANLSVHISENTKDCTLKKDQDSTQTGVKVSDSSVVEKSCTRSSVKVRKLCPKSKKFVFNVSETKESCASNLTLKENSQEVPTNCLPISKKESILMSEDSNDLEIMPEQGGECQKSPEFCEQESEKDGENYLDSASKILNLPKSSKETGKKSKDFTKDILHSSETIDSGIGIIDSKSADTKSVPILENITIERDTEKELNNDSNLGIHPKLSIDTEPLAIPENVKESVVIHEHIEKSVPNPEKVENSVVIPESTEESVPISDNIEKAMPNPQSTEEFVPILENIEESEPIPDNSEESKTISEKVEDSVIIPENTDQSVPSPEITKKSEPIPANTEEFKIISEIVEDSMPIPESTEESIPILVNIEESMSIPENTEEYVPVPANTEEYVPVLANTDGSEPIPEKVEESVAIHKTSEESDIISESTDDSLIIPGNVGKSVAVPKTIQEFVQIPKNVEASTAIPTNVAKFLSISDYIKKSKQVPRHIEASVAKSKNLKESVLTSENIEEAMEIPKNTEECDTIPENLEESLKYIETIEESLKIIENIEDSLEIPKNTEEIVLILEKTKAFVPIPENIEKCEPIHKNIEESNPNPENIDNTVNILENIEGETINIPKSIEKVLENTKVETLTSSKNFSREPNIPENSQEMENKFDNTELPIPTASEKIITENIMDYGKVETDSKTVDSGNAPVIDTGIRSQNSLEITESSSTGTFEAALDSKNIIAEQHEDNRGTISPTSTDLSGLEKMLSHQNRLTSKIDLKKMSIVNHANEESNNESNSNRGDTCALNEAPEEKVNYLDRYGIQHCYVNLDTIHIEGNTVSGTLLEKLLKKCRNKQKRIICQRAKLKRELNRNQSIKPDVLSDDDYVFSDEEPVENYKRQRHEQKGKFFTVVSLRNKEVIKYLNCSSSDSEESDDNYSLCSDGPLSNEPDSESEENEIDTRDTKSTQNLDIKNVRVMLEPIDHLLAQNNSIKLNPKILKELACKVKRKELINKGIQVANKENQLCSQSDKPSEMLNNSMDEFKQKIHPKLTIKKVRSKCQNERFHPIVNPPSEAIQHDPKVIKTLEFEEKRKALDKEIEMFLRKDTNVRLVSSETEVPFDHKRKSTLHVDLEKKYSGSENKESPKSVQHLLKTPHSKDIKTSGNGNIRNNDIVSECINTSTKIGPNTNLCNTKNSLPKNAFESEFESFTNGLCKIINIPSKGKKLIQIKTQNRNVCSKTPSKEICTSNSTKKVGPLSLNCVSDKFGAPNQICPQKKQFINRTNFLSKHIKTTLSPSTQSICKTMEFNTKSIVPTKNKPSGCQDILTRFENNPKYVNISIKESSKTSTDVVSGQVKSGKSVPKMPVSKINLKTVETSTITAKQSIQNATSVNAVSCVSNCQTSTPSKQLNTIPIKLGRPRKLIPPFKNVTLTKTVPKNTSCSKTNVSAISTTNVVKGKPRVKLIRPQIKKVIVEHLNKKEKGPATDRKLSDMYPSQNKKTDETKISETSTKDNEILQEPSVKCMLTQHQTTAPCGSTPPQHFEKTCQVKAQNENYKPESNGISVAKYSEMTNLNELSVDFDHSFPTPSKPSLQSSCSNPNLQLDISDSTLQDTFPYVEADALEDLFPDSVLNTTELFPQATSSELLLNLQEVSKVDSQVTSTVTDTSIAFPTYQSQAQTNINTFVATPHPPDSLFNNVVLEPPVKSHQMNSDPSNTKSPKLLTQKLRALRPFQGSSQNKTSSTALTKEDGTSSIESSKQATLDEPLSSSESLNSNSNQSQYDVKVSSNMFDINFHETIPSSPAVNLKPVVNATPPSNSSTSFLVPSSLSTSYASLSCPSKTFVNINSNPIPSISLVNSTPEPNIPITFFNINIVGSPSTSSLSVVSEQKSPNSPLQVASTSNTSHILNITPVSSCATSFNNMAPSSSTSYMTIVPQEPNPMMSFNSNEQCLNMENSLLVPNMEANSLNSTAPAITLTESNAIKFGSNISSQDNYGTSHVITYNTFESRQKETQYSTQQVNHSFLQPMDSFPDSLVSQQTSDLNKASPSNKTSPKSPRKAQKRKSPCVSSSCYSSAINSVISTYSNNFSPNIPNEYCPSVDKIKLSPLPPIQSLNSTLPVFQVPSNNDINISPATPIQMSINTAEFNIPVPSPSIPTAPDNKNENLYNYSTFSGQTLESSLNQASASNKTEKQESLIDGNYAGAEFQALTDWVLDEYFQIPKDILASNPLDSLVLPDTATAASSIETISSQLEASCQANDLLNMPSTSTQNSVDVVTSEYPPKHDTNESLSTLDKTTRLHRVYQILDTKSKQNRQWNQSGILRANHSYENVRHYRRLSDGHSNNLMIRLPAATTLTPVQSSCTKTFTSQSIKRKPTHEMSDQFKKQKVNHSNKDLNIVTKSSEYIAKSLPAKQSEVGETKQITKLPSKENTAPPRSQEVSNVRQSTSYPALSTTLVSHEAIVTSRESVITENTVKCHQQDPTKQGLIQNEQTNHLGNTEKGCRSIDKNLKSVHMKQLPNSNMKYRFIGNTLQPSTSVDNQTKPQLTLNITPNQGVIIPESGSTNIYPERGRPSSKQKSSRKCDDRQRPSEEKKHDINSLIEQQLKTVKKFCSEKNMNRYVSAKSKGPHTEAVSKKSVFNTGDFCIKSHDLFKPCPPLWKVNIEDKNITEFVYVLVDQEDEGKYSFIFKKNSCIGNFHSEDTNLWIKIYIGMEADSIQLDQVKNEQILEKFVIEKSFVVSSAYRNSFNLYVQVIISQAMNSNFLPYIEQGARDTCFFYRPWCEINAILKQYMKTMNRCFLLYDEQIVEALIRYPYCILAQGEQSAVQDNYTCPLCARSMCKVKMILKGPFYDRTNLASLDNHADRKETYLCEECGNLCVLFSKAVHFTYLAYQLALKAVKTQYPAAFESNDLKQNSPAESKLSETSCNAGVESRKESVSTSSAEPSANTIPLNKSILNDEKFYLDLFRYFQTVLSYIDYCEYFILSGPYIFRRRLKRDLDDFTVEVTYESPEEKKKENSSGEKQETADKEVKTDEKKEDRNGERKEGKDHKPEETIEKKDNGKSERKEEKIENKYDRNGERNDGCKKEEKKEDGKEETAGNKDMRKEETKCESKDSRREIEKTGDGKHQRIVRTKEERKDPIKRDINFKKTDEKCE